MAGDPRDTYRWKQLRARVLAEQGAECAQCGHTGSVANPLQVDHIQPVSTHPELAFDKTNLQVLCKKHNGQKSDNAPVAGVRINWYDPQWLTSIN